MPEPNPEPILISESGPSKSLGINLLFIALGFWLLFGCLELTGYSWQVPHKLAHQVENYLFHWSFDWLPLRQAAENHPNLLILNLLFGWIPAGILVLYIPYFFAVYIVAKGKGNLRTILTISILARLALIPGFPLLETDVYRYIWDGRMMVMGENPFEYPPQQILDALDAEEAVGQDPSGLQRIVDEIADDRLYCEILERVNNKEVPTLYFPTAQYCFAAADLVILTALPDPPDPEEVNWYVRGKFAQVLWKCVLFFFEVSCLILICLLLRMVCLSPCWVVVFGWSPLVLKEYSNTGHFDPIANFLVLAAFLVLMRIPSNLAEARRSGLWRRISSGVLLGLGIGCKLYPVFLIPFIARRLRLPGLVSILVTIFLLFLPFIGIGSSLFKGFATYSDRWEFNSSIVAGLEVTISFIQDLFRGGDANSSSDPESPMFQLAGVSFDIDAFFLAKAISACAFLAIWIYLIWKSARPLPPETDTSMQSLHFSFLVLATLLLCSPVTDPWYVCWLVPFLCFFPNRAWLFLTFAQQVYYVYFWNDWGYVRFVDVAHLPGFGWMPEYLRTSTCEIARLAEYVPFYCLLVYGWWSNRQKKERIE